MVLGLPPRGTPRPPEECITLIPPATQAPTNISLNVTPVGGGSPPYTRQAFLYDLLINIPSLPTGTILGLTWIAAFGPSSAFNNLHLTGYLGPTNDQAVGVTVKRPDGTIEGTTYAQIA